jgi:hypothetical protein
MLVLIMNDAYFYEIHCRKYHDRVIVLPNEYVTKKEFDAIASHPDMIFLYPNALYAEVKTDYASNTITLVRGAWLSLPEYQKWL